LGKGTPTTKTAKKPHSVKPGGYTDEACLRRLNKKTDLLQPDWVLVKKPGFGVWVGGSKPVFFKMLMREYSLFRNNLNVSQSPSPHLGEGFRVRAMCYAIGEQAVIAYQAGMLKADKLTEIVAKLIAILQQE